MPITNPADATIQHDLTPAEAKAINRMRMTPDQRHILQLTEAESARQAMVARMTPAKREAYESQRVEQQAEQARVAKLSQEQRRAEQLTREKARVEAELATPEIAAVVDKLVDGKVSEKDIIDIKPSPVKEV